MTNKLFQSIKPIQWLILLHAAILILTLALLMNGKGNLRLDREKIVVVPIDGVITMEQGSLRFGHSVSSLVQDFKDFEDDENIKAVVLRINSPGGSVGAVQELYRGIGKLKKKGKIIVSSFGEVSASGGYYLACAGNGIVLNPGTLTGSIGVVMQIPNFQGLLTKIGVSMETIKSGDLKDLGSPFRKMTYREKNLLKDIILDSYDQFFEAVKTGRNLKDEELKPLADGRIFSGRMAIKNKLADELGGLEEAIAMAKKLAKIESKKPQILTHKGKSSLDRFMQLFSKSPLKTLSILGQTETKIMYLMHP